MDKNWYIERGYALPHYVGYYTPDEAYQAYYNYKKGNPEFDKSQYLEWMKNTDGKVEEILGPNYRIEVDETPTPDSVEDEPKADYSVIDKSKKVQYAVNQHLTPENYRTGYRDKYGYSGVRDYMGTGTNYGIDIDLSDAGIYKNPQDIANITPDSLEKLRESYRKIYRAFNQISQSDLDDLSYLGINTPDEYNYFINNGNKRDRDKRWLEGL